MRTGLNLDAAISSMRRTLSTHGSRDGVSEPKHHVVPSNPEADGQQLTGEHMAMGAVDRDATQGGFVDADPSIDDRNPRPPSALRQTRIAQRLAPSFVRFRSLVSTKRSGPNSEEQLAKVVHELHQRLSELRHEVTLSFNHLNHEARARSEEFLHLNHSIVTANEDAIATRAADQRAIEMLATDVTHQAQWIVSETTQEIGRLPFLQQPAHARIEAYNARIEAYNARIEASNARIEASNPRIKASNPRIKASNARIEASNARIEASNARIEAYSYATARRLAIPIGSDVLLRSNAGYILCPNTDLGAICGVIDTGDIEVGVRKLIERILEPGNVFVDAGANLGWHVLAAACAVGPTGKVIAFEPFLSTANLMRRSIAMNGFQDRCEVHQMALADEDGRTTLHIGSDSGHHSLYPLVAGDPTISDVPVAKLDSTLKAGSRVDVLKIDVEGAEVRVLAGAQRVLRDNPNAIIIIEFGPSHLERCGVTQSDFFDAAMRSGHRWRVVEPMTGLPQKWSRKQLSSAFSTNLVIAPASSPAWKQMQP